MSEAELVRQAAGGSRDALGALYRDHADAVHALAYRLTGTREDAEDVLQDVFVGLPRALEHYEERGRFTSWLLRIATRTALMRVRRRGRSPLDLFDAGVEPVTSGRDDPRSVVDHIVVRDALRDMPEPLRLVFLLKEVEGYSHGDVARLLGLSAGSSRTRLHRAWRFLRRRLGEAE